MNYVRYYYSGIALPGWLFGFSHVCVSEIMNNFENFVTNKAAGIDGLSGIFLNDGAKIMSKPISDLINLSISLQSVQESCKVAKLNPLFKKNVGPISLLPLISKVVEKVIHDKCRHS